MDRDYLVSKLSRGTSCPCWRGMRFEVGRRCSLRSSSRSRRRFAHYRGWACSCYQCRADSRPRLCTRFRLAFGRCRRCSSRLRFVGTASRAYRCMTPLYQPQIYWVPDRARARAWWLHMNLCRGCSRPQAPMVHCSWSTSWRGQTHSAIRSQAHGTRVCRGLRCSRSQAGSSRGS